jgi:hypothetical protein
MGFIKEPEGITFYVENRELTDEEKKLLSEFIASQRLKNKRRIELKKKQKIRKRISRKNVLIKK